jgi:hypothetical protein
MPGNDDLPQVFRQLSIQNLPFLTYNYLLATLRKNLAISIND